MATRSKRPGSRTPLSERLSPPKPRVSKKFVALSLFWRTFFLLALLLAGGVFAWVQTFRALEFEPRAVQAAQQIASLVNLTRSALLATDGINRIAIIKSVSTLDAVKLTPREPTDKWEPFVKINYAFPEGAKVINTLVDEYATEHDVQNPALDTS